MGTKLEKARKELIARNTAMMEVLLKGAANDLASTVQADAEQAAQPARHAELYKKRLAAEAQQAGRRRLSSRAASKKTKRKIVGVLPSRCS